MVLTLAVGVTMNAAVGFINRPINRSDAAHLIDYYERLRKNGLREAYRAECDFMVWGSEDARTGLDPSCTAAGRDHTIFLWGDSFAQALSLGIREQLPPGAALAQVTTSSCAAAIGNFDLTVRDRRCETANLYAMDQIRLLRPSLVIVAQAGGQTGVDWEALSARVVELGARSVAVVGPFPLWRPGLPRIFAEHHLEERPEYVRTGLDQDVFAHDRELAAMLAELPNVTYVSLIDRLCRNGACLARVPGEIDLELLALDFGHLTPKGSSYVGRLVMKPLLERAGRR
jgi:hypothetical protein